MAATIDEFGTISLGARSNRVGSEILVSLQERVTERDLSRNHYPVAKLVDGTEVLKAISSLGSTKGVPV
jgi:hypothetical protein